MKCPACGNEYPKPSIFEGVAHFVCNECGNALSIEGYQALTKEQIIDRVELAFSDVALGDGIGLLEAQALDDYEPEEVQRRQREKDEKSDWKSIAYEALHNCHSSLSFFDAAGMRFHLPAFIVGSLKGEVNDPLFHLTNLDDYAKSKLVELNKRERDAVIQYLIWCLTEDEYNFYWTDIAQVLRNYWQISPNK